MERRRIVHSILKNHMETLHKQLVHETPAGTHILKGHGQQWHSILLAFGSNKDAENPESCSLQRCIFEEGCDSCRKVELLGCGFETFLGSQRSWRTSSPRRGCTFRRTTASLDWNVELRRKHVACGSAGGGSFAIAIGVEKRMVEKLAFRIDFALAILDVAVFGPAMTFLQTGIVEPFRSAEAEPLINVHGFKRVALGDKMAVLFAQVAVRF
jgi:hypothetical protein